MRVQGDLAAAAGEGWDWRHLARGRVADVEGAAGDEEEEPVAGGVDLEALVLAVVAEAEDAAALGGVPDEVDGIHGGVGVGGGAAPPPRAAEDERARRLVAVVGEEEVGGGGQAAGQDLPHELVGEDGTGRGAE